MPRQLTIRGVPDEVANRLERLSKSRRTSLNATVIDILAREVGFSARRQRLTRYATWTGEDMAEFDAALRAQRIVDEHLWR